MNINSGIVLFYRKLAFSVLGLFFLGVLAYVSLVIFYTGSTTWAVPFVLSPTQEKVLRFQPQIASLEATINLQKVEIETHTNTRDLLIGQLNEMNGLIEKVGQTVTTEASQLQKTSRMVSSLLRAKNANIAKTDAVIKEANTLLAQVDSELQAKLITSDQAAQRKITLQSSINAATELRSSALQSAIQVQQLDAMSRTLSGGTSSITGIEIIKQAADINTLKAQTELQINTAERTISMLAISYKENLRVLTTAKATPYYKALREDVSLAFMPYSNINSVKINDAVYDCYLQVILCRNVGSVKSIQHAEEAAKHPLFKTDLRGKTIEIDFTDKTSITSQIVFIGSKPLFI